MQSFEKKKIFIKLRTQKAKVYTVNVKIQLFLENTQDILTQVVILLSRPNGMVTLNSKST